jgi:hypothetical protein
MLLKESRQLFTSHFNPGRMVARSNSLDPNQAFRPLLTLPALFYFLFVAGCATTPTITPTVRAQAGLPRPDRILVHDFELANADADLNPDQRSTSGALTEEQIRVGRAVAQVLAVSLIDELKSRGIEAQRAGTAAPPEMNTLSIRGRFLWREKDAGTMRARIWFYQGSGVSSRLVAQADADVPSDLKRGAASVGGSAYTAAQEADAKRMARELAERVARYYREQGWLS